MAGYGNRTAPDYTGNEHDTTRLGLTDSHGPYSNAHPKYGSGATGGAGFGNKSNSLSPGDVSDPLRFGLHKDTAPYSGATRIGSGSTAGAGYGNKTGSFSSDGTGDSTVGKIIEKAGHIVHSAALAEKGRVMRDDKKSQGIAKEEGPFAN